MVPLRCAGWKIVSSAEAGGLGSFPMLFARVSTNMDREQIFPCLVVFVLVTLILLTVGGS